MNSSSSHGGNVTAGPLSALFGGSFGDKALLFSEPFEVVELRSSGGLADFFAKLERRLDEGCSLAGYIGYEAGYGFEPEALGSFESGEDRLPLAWFGVYRSRGTVVPEGLPRDVLSGEEPALEELRFDLDRERYAGAITAIRERIAAGDVYQVNFTGRFGFRYEGAADDLFMRLCGMQPGAYSAFLDMGTHRVLSLSPELFFSLDGRRIETRPMKGTAPRGSGEDEDRERKAWLRSDEKNRAENLMIVDLLRNDLGRICKPGSVEVPELFVTQSYPTLHQMVSGIRGELRENCSLFELFRAIFPCGSVTGAPKIRAMQLIRQLESSPRGVYTGAIGYILPDRSMRFNVAIRTLVLTGDRGEYGAGSGIVWDSRADEEYEECRLKARLLESGREQGFELFESLLYSVAYLWLEEHLDRLAGSAAALGFRFERERVRRELESFARSDLVKSGRYKVRLALRKDGTTDISVSALPAPPEAEPVRVCMAKQAIPAGDPLRAHKTTRRDLYDRLLRKAQSEGFGEVLFRNDRGEVTEGAVSNVIIRKNGRYLTPPLSSGLLDGVYRRYFLETRLNAGESPLAAGDIAGADCFFLCSSVRGLRRAVLCDYTIE